MNNILKIGGRKLGKLFWASTKPDRIEIVGPEWADHKPFLDEAATKMEHNSVRYFMGIDPIDTVGSSPTTEMFIKSMDAARKRMPWYTRLKIWWNSPRTTAVAFAFLYGMLFMALVMYFGALIYGL